ncbi:hypothetical protein EDB19DRAFT_987420 [Suillus lakei]|nr:hypothetical protein EDB19DRAFT_987420 [Suillus lakei]
MAYKPIAKLPIVKTNSNRPQTMMLNLTPVSCSIELQAEEVPCPTMPPSTPPRRLHHSPFDLAGSPSTPGRRSSSPPSSPSLVSVTGSAASTTSDAEDIYLLTPKSKRSGGACHIANASVGAGSPAPSHFPENKNSDTSLPDGGISSFEDQRIFDGLLDNGVHGQGTSENVEQKVKDAYLRHMGQLNAKLFLLRYVLPGSNSGTGTHALLRLMLGRHGSPKTGSCYSFCV